MDDDTPIPPRAHFICDGCQHIKDNRHLSIARGGFMFCTDCEPKDAASKS